MRSSLSCHRGKRRIPFSIMPTIIMKDAGNSKWGLARVTGSLTLVIGGSEAGTAAALLPQEQGTKVVLITKLRHGDANTMMADRLRES